MNIQKFTAQTSREALAKARMTFGDGTLILSNRATPTGIEVIATGEDTLAELDQADAARQGTRPSGQTGQTISRKMVSAAQVNPNSAVVDDATQLAMSTLSFQDYVRERMLRRRQEALNTHAPDTMPDRPPISTFVKPEKQNSPIQATPPAHWQQSQKARPNMQSGVAPAPVSVPVPALSHGIADELHAMKSMIEERFNTLTWLGQARQNPIQTNLMLKLLRCGYSATLARTILERMPENFDAADATRWVTDVLVRNLRTDATTQSLLEEGGSLALIGSTGVGKTTTAAKLAGLCARTHGTNSVGLITLDTYRVGAHEQLRAYGRMLGVVAHLAHDRPALQDLLGLLSNKKMVLIDTTGLAPNDPRKRDMLDMLDLPGIKRLLVLNAGSHGDTLDDAVAQFKSGESQHTILSKIDEAAKMGPALDTCIRHQLILRGTTIGQKVPQDWERADAAKLTALSMRTCAKSAYDPKAEELNFFFSESAEVPMGRCHA